MSVTAVDDAGNESGMAGPVTGTTLFFDTDPPLLEATDSIHVEGTVVAVSSEDGVIYLVPGGTDKELAAIMGATIDSVAVTGSSAVDIAISGLGNGIYWLYARDTAYNISEPEVVTVFGVGIETALAGGFRLYPNPMKNMATFTFTLQMEQALWLTVMDSRGRIARNEFLGRFPAGDQQVAITRKGLAEGLYLYSISGTGPERLSGRLMITD